MDCEQKTAQTVISRREFSGRSLGAVSTLGLLGVREHSFGQTSNSPPEMLAAAVVGAGGVSRFHAEHQFKPFFEIKAICDVDEFRVKSYNKDFANSEATVCSDYRELIDREDIDVVIVCTPDHWHTKITIDALRSGKDVYCEKPLTLTVDEGRLIRRVLGETDRILQIGTQQRSDPNFQTAVALARSGRLGKVTRITAAIGGGPVGGPFTPSEPPSQLDWNRWLGQAPWTEYIPERCHGNFRWWYEYSGGKMTDWGAHHVDIAQWALEPAIQGPMVIEPTAASHPVPMKEGIPVSHNSYNTATTFRVRCKFEGGIEIVICDSAQDLGFDNGLLFECEGGRYFVNRGKLTGRPVEHLVDDPIGPEFLSPLRKGRPVMNHFANFYWSCRERTEPISDAQSHLHSLNICHLANISMRLGRTLQWDPVKEELQGDDTAENWLGRRQRPGFEVV